MLAAAKTAGVGEPRLHELMNMRVGLAAGRRLSDVAREADEEHVLRVIRTAGFAGA